MLFFTHRNKQKQMPEKIKQGYQIERNCIFFAKAQ